MQFNKYFSFFLKENQQWENGKGWLGFCIDLSGFFLEIGFNVRFENLGEKGY